MPLIKYVSYLIMHMNYVFLCARVSKLCACVRACVRACGGVCVCARARVCVCGVVPVWVRVSVAW